jgi:hypothetical protein
MGAGSKKKPGFFIILAGTLEGKGTEECFILARMIRIR